MMVVYMDPLAYWSDSLLATSSWPFTPGNCALGSDGAASICYVESRCPKTGVRCDPAGKCFWILCVAPCT